jgi:hypothetical protein
MVPRSTRNWSRMVGAGDKGDWKVIDAPLESVLERNHFAL